jgi:hypothetical protein
MLSISNATAHDQWLCGVGSRPLRSPCKGWVRLVIAEPYDATSCATIEVSAWGLQERDVGSSTFKPLISLASLVRSGVDFSHTQDHGPLLSFPNGKSLSLDRNYELRACII